MCPSFGCHRAAKRVKGGKGEGKSGGGGGKSSGGGGGGGPANYKSPGQVKEG